MSLPRLGPAGRLGAAAVSSKLTPLLVVTALALGGLAIGLTPREEEPQIIVPVVDLFVGLPGASPAEVETRVTMPLETRMWAIPGVEYVYSASAPGGALVTVRFEVGRDRERSLVSVYEKLAGGLDQIPPGATLPLVRERSIDDVPIVAITLASDTLDGAVLRRLGLELRRELSTVEDVAAVDVLGGERRAMRVLLDPARLSGVGLDPPAIAGALRTQNARSEVGTLTEGDRDVIVEAGSFLAGVADLESLVVGVYDGRPVRLRDVATVVDGSEEPRTHVFQLAHGASGLEPAVTVAIAKRRGADATRVAQRVHARLDALRGRLLPPEVRVTVSRDYGATAATKAHELLLHLGIAVLSVSLVIGLSLGWRGALVVFLSVPISFALTLFVYWLFGYTLNRVTLFALIFVTGIVVDDSIIVVENIVRHLSKRHLSNRYSDPLEASIRAVDEVGNPTILATLTVIASVLPMAFVRGLMGPYMRPMPIGASLAMLFSLLVAFIAAPWLGKRLLVAEEGAEKEEGEGVETTRTYRVYRALMTPLLGSRPGGRRRAGWVLALAGAALLGAIALVPLGAVAVKMLPFDNKSELLVLVDAPEGTPLERTSAIAREIAERLGREDDVTDVELYAGVAAPVSFNGLVRHYDLRRAAHQADVQVNLLSKDERGDQSHALAKRYRPLVEEIGRRHGVDVKVVEVPPGPPVLSTLVAEVYGPDEAARRRLAGEVEAVFRSTPGVVDVDSSLEAAQPKRVLAVDRERAALHGVAQAEVVDTLAIAAGGRDVDLLHDGDELEPVPIRLELPSAERSFGTLESLRLRSRSGALVPLADLVRAETTTREPTLLRKNLQPVVYVTGDVAGTAESPIYAMSAMTEKLAALRDAAGERIAIRSVGPPESTERVSIKWDGEWQITYEVFRDLGGAFAIVLLLMYFLLVGWLGSFRLPLVMMLAIPLALVGVLPGHWFFGAFFTATSMIGVIALAGIMVRNSVLLVDFMRLARARGATLEHAVLEAGAVRFRPILLTAGTVVVGAFVMIFDPIFQGLGVSLMFGAFASTALTLVVVPVVLYWMEAGKPG